MKKMYVYCVGLLSLLIVIGCGSSVDNEIDTRSVKKYNIKNNSTVYETAEDGSTKRWRTVEGPYSVQIYNMGANGSSRSILTKQNWKETAPERYYNEALYVMNMYNNKREFNLEFDLRTYRDLDQPCFMVGVEVETYWGTKRILFDVFQAHNNAKAYITNLGELSFPLSEDYRFGGQGWLHLKFNLQTYLHKFQPKNNITKVKRFFVRGGDIMLDNIRLTK